MKLRIEVERFREWAAERHSPSHDSRKDQHGAGEWECDYPEWSSLYAATADVLSSGKRLSEEEVSLVMYALARDNEDEQVLDLLVSARYAALTLCQAVGSAEQDARWQLAVALGRIGSAEAVERLRDFLADEAEYVRKRARLALDEATNKNGAQPDGTDNSGASPLRV